MTLYFYTTEYGTMDIKEIAVENVLETVTNNYKTKEGVFPFFDRNLISSEFKELVFEITNATDDNGNYSTVCCFYTENRNKEHAVTIFKNHYNDILATFENSIADIEALLSETETKYNRYFNDLLKKAIIIASTAHCGQKDKGGKPYIEHPKAVADMLGGTREKIVAMLHDVIEDTNVTSEFLLEQGFPEDIVDAVVLLSKNPETNYEEYLKAVKANPLARIVKLADLTHNSDLSRIPNPTEKDIKRKEKYLRAIKSLEV